MEAFVAGRPDCGPDIDDDVVLKLLVDEVVVDVLVFVCTLGRLRCAGTGIGLGATCLASSDGSAAALVASLLLSLVQLGACLRDRPLELLERRREVRTRQLLERLGGVVAVRRPALSPELLAGGDDEPARVLLGGDYDERAAVKLACSPGAVDELR